MLKIWISAFIPKDIAGYTLDRPNHPGETMIPGPSGWPGDCWSTDQRVFSQTPSAKSRMRSLVVIDESSMSIVNDDHKCDFTIECDCEDGKTECEKEGDKDDMKIIGVSSSSSEIRFRFKGAANNPCWIGSPDIDWDVLVLVKITRAGISVEALDGSKVDDFPAFEMYAEYAGTTKAVFKRSPEAGKTPGDLWGNANNPVSGIAQLP